MGKQKKNKGGGGAKKKSKKGGRSFKPSGSNYRGKNAGLPGETAKVDNPFEIRMHRSKHDNLGRRARHEKGLPGVSRSKAIEKVRNECVKLTDNIKLTASYLIVLFFNCCTFIVIDELLCCFLCSVETPY